MEKSPNCKSEKPCYICKQYAFPKCPLFQQYIRWKKTDIWIFNYDYKLNLFEVAQTKKSILKSQGIRHKPKSRSEPDES